MIKSIKAILAQDKEKFKVPRKVQDLIPIKNIWPDGIFKVGNKFSKSFRFSDINYLVASREDKESMFLTYSELLNSLDSGATTKITINNHRLNRSDFEESILMPMKQDGLDEYRKEYKVIEGKLRKHCIIHLPQRIELPHTQNLSVQINPNMAILQIRVDPQCMSSFQRFVTQVNLAQVREICFAPKFPHTVTV